MTEKLERCRMCGGKAVVEKRPLSGWAVKCENKCCFSFAHTREEAVEKWNSKNAGKKKGE